MWSQSHFKLLYRIELHLCILYGGKKCIRIPLVGPIYTSDRGGLFCDPIKYYLKYYPLQ